MNISKELLAIRELLNLTQQELASELDVTFETINRWENNKVDIEKRNLEKVYSYAFKKGIFINNIYELLYKEEFQSSSNVVLFHGSKKELDFPIDLKHSKPNNDFGIGFYLGESFKQAGTYISNSASTNVYIFSLDISTLSTISFNVNLEWMIAIAYYRGWLSNYANHSIIKEITDKVESCDVIIAPIADNRMFDIISEFIRGEITDQQCQHCLAATDIGMQYVLKTNKALNNLSLIKNSYLSNPEKDKYKNENLSMHALSQDKVKIAKIEYRGKGHYIDEVLK